MFASFKLRDEEWEQDGRFFNSYNGGSCLQLIEIHRSLRVKSIWVSDDARPERKDEKWLNASATTHQIATRFFDQARHVFNLGFATWTALRAAAHVLFLGGAFQ